MKQQALQLFWVNQYRENKLKAAHLKLNSQPQIYCSPKLQKKMWEGFVWYYNVFMALSLLEIVFFTKTLATFLETLPYIYLATGKWTKLKPWRRSGAGQGRAEQKYSESHMWMPSKGCRKATYVFTEFFRKSLLWDLSPNIFVTEIPYSRNLTE